jgi:hypothetical protein
MADAARIHLDHVGFIVPDLVAASVLMAQLGFRQTQRADHTRTDERGQLVSAGSSQHSIMLENGYIELMQITDPSKGHPLASAPTVRFGLHILALGTFNAAACHAFCQSRGVAVGPLLHWARPVKETGADGMARFAYFGSAWSPPDPSYVCWVQHLTPELMRPPQLLRHDNRAMSLVGVQYRGPRQLAMKWRDQLVAAGARPIDVATTLGSSAIELQLPNASITISVDERLPAVTPQALVLEFSDCATLLVNCEKLGIAVQKLASGAFSVDLTGALGMHLICKPAPEKGVVP